jgi:hypothetical protein
LRLRFVVAVTLPRDPRVDALRRRRRRHNMSSGTWCEQVPPSVGLINIGIPILTSYNGKSGTKFSKKIGLWIRENP